MRGTNGGRAVVRYGSPAAKCVQRKVGRAVGLPGLQLIVCVPKSLVRLRHCLPGMRHDRKSMLELLRARIPEDLASAFAATACPLEVRASRPNPSNTLRPRG